MKRKSELQKRKEWSNKTTFRNERELRSASIACAAEANDIYRASDNVSLEVRHLRLLQALSDIRAKLS